VECALLLDVVVGERPTILQLLTRKDQALLVRRNALLVLNLGLDIVDGIRGLDLKGDGLAGDCRDDLSVFVGVVEAGGNDVGGRVLTSLDEDLHVGGGKCCCC
jgi:hypothetical protein